MAKKEWSLHYEKVRQEKLLWGNADLEIREENRSWFNEENTGDIPAE